MFDSVLRPEELPKSRFGTGALIALVVHLGLFASGFWILKQRAAADRQDVAVTFVKPPPPPPPPPAPQHARPKPKPTEPQTVLHQAIVAPTVIPAEKPPEQEPPKDLAMSGEGVEGGDIAGVPGGIVGGVVDAADAPVAFNESMTPPAVLSGPDPQYTDKALEHEVQGLMVVKCVVTLKGVVRNCRVLKSLPFLDRAVIDALEHRRYRPALLQGRPIEVDYTFKIRMTLPQ